MPTNAAILGTNTAPMGNITSTGVFNVNYGRSYVGTVDNGVASIATNALFNVAGGLIQTGNVNNTLGTISISSGDLSSISANTNTITNNSGQTISVSGTGSIGNNNQFTGINNAGIVTAETGGTINSSINLTLSGTTLNPKDNGIVNLTGGAIVGNIVGPSSAPGGTVSVNSNFTYTGANPSIQDVATIQVTGTSNFVINSPLSNVDKAFNTNVGSTTTVNIYNGLSGNGSINNAGTLTIASGLSGDIIGTASSAMGNVTNTGAFNANSGNAYFSNFTNSSSTAIFNIAGGVVKTNNINNNAGAITISMGDLSNVSSSNCTITNAAGQTITVSGTGTIGANNAARVATIVDNNGIFNVSGGKALMAGGFTNNNSSASLNITGGIVQTGNINNTIGSMTISNGDLSSVNAASVLTNAAGQTINISGTGTIGVNSILASINNSGTVNIASNNVNVTNILNNDTGIINVNSNGVIANATTLSTIGVVNLNSGGTINTPITFGTHNSTSGVLNLSGGLINGIVGGALNSPANSPNTGIGTVNVTADFSYSGIYDPISNIANINVKSGNFSIGGLIENINNSFNIEEGATTTINNGGNIANNSSNNLILTNSGTLTVNTGGTINVPVVFGSNGGILNLAGGSVNAAVGGSSSSRQGAVNITGGFTYNNSDQYISNIGSFNVNSGNLEVNSPITGINTAFTTAASTTTTINSGGYLAGDGAITNAGTITVAGGTIGTASTVGGVTTITSTVGGIINSGSLVIGNNVYVSDNINNTNALATTGGNSTNEVGGIYPTGTTVTQTTTSGGTITVNSGGNIVGTGAQFLQNLGVVTVNSGGTISMPINFGPIDSGVLNFSGGAVTSNITGGGSTAASSTGTININQNYTYDLTCGVISNVNSINVNNTSNFTVNNSIVGINKAFNTATGTTTTISAGNQLIGSGIVTNSGTINLLGGNIGSPSVLFDSLANSGTIQVSENNIGGGIYVNQLNNNSGGTLTVNTNGIVNTGATGVINLSGRMNTSGIITSPINFNANNAILNISGGSITGSITGYTTGVTSSGGSNNNNNNSINIAGHFTTNGVITNVNSINLNSGAFVIDNAITGLSDAFTTLYGTTTILNSTGNIAGTGAIKNTGTTIVSGGSIGTIATVNIPLGNIYNNGIFIVQSDASSNHGRVLVGSIVNGGSATGSGTATSVTNQSTVYGNININVTPLALNIDVNNSPITNTTLPAAQTVPENTNLVFSNAQQNAITIAGMDNNGGTINLTATNGILTVANATGLLSISGNNSNNVYLSGSLTNLNNALQGLVFTPNTNYIGSAVLQIVTQNNQVTSANSSTTGSTSTHPTVPSSYLPVLNITSGYIETGSVTNTLGTINISGTGDLSSVDSTNSGTLTNAANQTINISDTGTIGANHPIGTVVNSGIVKAGGGNIIVGTVTNSGTINANSGNITTGAVTNNGAFNANGSPITMGTFTNNNANAALNVTNGIVQTGDVTNTLGSLTIGSTTIPNSGDLSSANSNTPSNLTNAASQTISVLNGATIGNNGMLGDITNNGIITNNGSIKCINFTNNATNSTLNISSGKLIIGNSLQTGSVTNTLGTINIATGGDISSVNGTSPGNLTNNANQNIKVSSGGAIGSNAPLNSIINNGIMKVTATIPNAIRSISFSNNDFSTTTITNSSANGISLAGGTTNSGQFTVNNTATITDVQLGPFSNNNTADNNSGGVFTINGPLTAMGGITNSNESTVNVSANFDVGAGNLFDNFGTVQVLQPAAMVNGSYTVEPTGTHVMIIDNNIPGTLTLNNGAVTLNSGATLSIDARDNTLLGDNQMFTVMAGSNAATMNNPINLLGATDLISYTLALSGNNIIITTHRQSIAGIVEAAGNMTVVPVATVLDSLINNGVFGDLRTALSKLEGLPSQQQVSNAVTQLSPDLNSIAETWSVVPSNVFGVISERMYLLARAGINNIQTGFSAGGMQSANGVWIKGLGGVITQKERNSFVGYTANTAGLAFGMDHQIGDDAWLGVGLSSVGTHVNSRDFPSKKTKVSSRQITLYGNFSPEDYYVDYFAAMAFNKYKLMRSVQYNGLNYTATADYNSTQPSTKVATGYIYSIDDFKIIPNLSLQYSTLSQNMYNEAGAGGLSLQQVNNAKLTQLEGGVGVKFAILHKEDDEKTYNPDIHFMMLHDFKSSAPTTTAQFLGGGGGFTVQGIIPDKTTYNVGAGLTFIHQDRIHFTANYELRIKNKYVGHAGSLAVKYQI